MTFLHAYFSFSRRLNRWEYGIVLFTNLILVGLVGGVFADWVRAGTVADFVGLIVLILCLVRYCRVWLDVSAISGGPNIHA